MTVAGLRPGDEVLGWTVVANDERIGTDGECTHHELTMELDGEQRRTILPRGRRFDIRRGTR